LNRATRLIVNVPLLSFLTDYDLSRTDPRLQRLPCRYSGEIAGPSERATSMAGTIRCEFTIGAEAYSFIGFWTASR
jgi:hypothetical protein